MNRGLPPVIPARRPYLLCLAAVLLAPLPVAAVDDEAPPEVPVVLSLNRTRVKPGSKATLVLSVRTEVPLRSISIALDFEESRVKPLDVRRLQRGIPTDPAAADIASTSISYEDREPGDQVQEGWIHILLNALTEQGALDLETRAEVPLVEIDFQVLASARPGFSAVKFATVGPLNGLPATVFVTAAGRADLAAPAQNLPPERLQDGGIEIIGEVGFFMRGDTSFDRRRDISDPILCLNYLFAGGMPMPCADAADSNDDGALDISDPLYTLIRLFESAAAFPEPEDWGLDPTPDVLGCAVYPGL